MYVLLNDVLIQIILSKKMQSLRQQKQQYLRENILDQNYDADQFMQFCQSSKGSIDIDSWTFNQLVEIVGQFIRTQNNKKKQDQYRNSEQDQPFSGNETNNIWDQFNQITTIPQTKPDKTIDLNVIDLDFLMGISSPKSQSPNLQKTQAKKQPFQFNYMTNQSGIIHKIEQNNKSFIDGYNNVNNHKNNTFSPENVNISPQKANIHYRSYTEPTNQVPNKIIPMQQLNADVQIFEGEIECKKITLKTKLNGTQEVVINGHQIINPNVFIPNYVLYTMTINPLNIQVKRKMKDYETLRILLKKLFPTTQIPFLERYGRLSQTEPAIIKRQKLFIQSFMNSLLMNPGIRCKLLQDFLLCEDPNNLKKIFKQYQKLEKPRSIQGLYTPSGKTKIKINPNHKKYLDQQSLYLMYIQTNFTKLKVLYDQFIACLLQNTKILTQITQTFDNLRDNIKNINTIYGPEYKSFHLELTFNSLSQLHRNWNTSFKTQSKIIQSEIRHLFRFQQSNTETMRQLFKINQNVVNDGYFRRTDRQHSSKDAYQSKKLFDYKLSLQNPSKNITVLKYQAAYIQQQTVQQFKRYLKQLSIKLNNKFNLFSMMQLNIDNDLDNIWKDFQKSTITT